MAILTVVLPRLILPNMKRRLSTVGILVICCFLSASVSELCADGVYLPDRAIKKLPEIPTQRVLLTWKDGTETLVIASTLDSEAQKLGWLIPLPSVPKEMSKADPGALRTLAFCIQPRITHDLTRSVNLVTITVVWFLLAALLLKFYRALLALFLVMTLFLFVPILLLPGLDTAGLTDARMANIRVERTAKVGAYEIDVLRAGGASDLNQWLTENSFTSFPAAAEPTIQDYVRRGWVFVAIKLSRGESGANTPHPVKLVFPAREPIYPWKLTSLAGGQPFLELFIVGPSRAGAGKLKTEFCQRLSGHGVLYADNANISIGHPEIVPLLWDGCVLTKLSGHLNSRRQIDDLPIHWSGFEPYQQHFFTTTGARSFAWILFVSVLGIICIPGMLLCKTPDGETFDGNFYFRRLLPRTLVVGLALAGAAYCILPKLGSADVQVIHRGRLMSLIFPNALWHRINLILEMEPDLLQQEEGAIGDAILRRLPNEPTASWKPGRTNVLQGQEIHLESSPGNFTIEKRDGKVAVKVYDRAGTPKITTYTVPEQKPIVSQKIQ